jgi:hypothetical protein
MANWWRIVRDAPGQGSHDEEGEDHPRKDEGGPIPMAEPSVRDEESGEPEARHREDAHENDLPPSDQNRGGDERKEAEDERVLRQRGAHGIADVDVSLALCVCRDRVGKLGEVGPDRDERHTDDERWRAERGGEGTSVGDGAIAGDERNREPTYEQEGLKGDLHACPPAGRPQRGPRPALRGRAALSLTISRRSLVRIARTSATAIFRV